MMPSGQEGTNLEQRSCSDCVNEEACKIAHQSYGLRPSSVGCQTFLRIIISGPRPTRQQTLQWVADQSLSLAAKLSTFAGEVPGTDEGHRLRVAAMLGRCMGEDLQKLADEVGAQAAKLRALAGEEK